MRLVDRSPALGAMQLAERFRPPPRFDTVRFDNYVPDPAFPSQMQARERLRSFARGAGDSPKTRKFWTRTKAAKGRQGIYLDGGFGVGKTHLLASLWHESSGSNAYMTFTELTAFIGFAGMPKAVEVLGRHDLLCIDEFELDDVANTLMVVTFLRSVMNGKSTRVAVTSNTLPDKLGEKRFSASEFRREIAAIASHFDELQIDGSDFRVTHARSVAHAAAPVSERTTLDDFELLIRHLRLVHPAQYGAMVEGIEAAVITGVDELDAQDAALLFVALVDKLYDSDVPVHVAGLAPERIFASDYRNGAYKMKYGRAESRLTTMANESAGLF